MRLFYNNIINNNIIMTTTLQDICNNNPKNMPSQELYDNFNNFIFSSDIKVLGKLLH